MESGVGAVNPNGIDYDLLIGFGRVAANRPIL
jgi:hypothetical protein